MKGNVMTYELLKETEAAVLLNLSKSMLRKMRALGNGPDVVKIGASVRYPAGAPADGIATNFLGSIAQDIVERFNETSNQNLRDALASCVLLTDSKSNVPDPLQKELNATQITLGQWILKNKQ
jgi:hypothetical protein